MEWHKAIETIRPYVVRISTPRGSGTGWLVSRSTTSKMCAIATAAHVVDQAHYWEEPIRLHHPESGQSILLREPDRSIVLDPKLDSASILFELSGLPLPDATLELVAKDKFIKPGVEIGWLGFPAIPYPNLCFFSGRISAYVEDDATYLVDGVAINGVSGGPALHMLDNKVQLLGTLSAYIPNRSTGESLPGLAVVRDVTHFHEITERFRSFDEAKAQETPATEQPRPEPDGSPSLNPGPAK